MLPTALAAITPEADLCAVILRPSEQERSPHNTAIWIPEGLGVDIDDLPKGRMAYGDVRHVS